MEPLRFQNSVPLVVRVILAVSGLSIVGVAVWDLHAALWPINLYTPVVLLLICGAAVVGALTLTGGLFGWEDSWTVRPDEIEVILRNPFTSRARRLSRSDIASIETIEREDMDGVPYWAVELWTVSRTRHRIYRSGTQEAAERFSQRIRKRLAGEDGDPE